MAITWELDRGGLVTFASGRQGPDAHEPLHLLRLELHPAGTPALRTYGFVHLSAGEALELARRLTSWAGGGSVRGTDG